MNEAEPEPEREPPAGEAEEGRAAAPPRSGEPRAWRDGASHPARSALLWPLAVAAAAVLPFLVALPGAATLAWRDTALLFSPMRPLVSSALRSLRLPLWSPWEGTGQPIFAALAHSVLHPVSVASAFAGLGTHGYLLGYLAFAAAGAFLAARSLGGSRAASAGAGLAYALSGYVLGMTCNAVFLAGAASTPWIVAGLLAASGGGGWRLAAGGAGTAFAVFAGEPQSLVVGLAIGAALGLAAHGRAGLPRAAIGALLGLGLGAIQIAPAAALVAQSARLTGVAVRASDAQWPLDPARLVELLAPGFFWGRVVEWDAPVFRALGTPAERPVPWAPSVFVGIAVLLFALLAARRSTRGRLLVALALAFAWAAMGHHLGASQLLGRLPGWNVFRYAEKLVAPVTLCLSLAAALGIDAAREDRRFGRIALAAAATLAAAWLVVFLLPALPIAAAPPPIRALARDHLAAGLAHAALSAIALAGLAVASPRMGRAFAPAAAALLYVEALAAAPFAIHVGSARAEAACPPPLRAHPLEAPRIQAMAAGNAVPAGTPFDPIDALTDKLARLGVPSLNTRCGVETLEPYTSFETLRTYYTILAPASRVRVGWRFGATHVIAEPPSTAAGAEQLARATAGGRPLPSPGPGTIWEVPHREWATFAPGASWASGLQRAVALTSSAVAKNDPAVVVEAPALPGTGPGTILGVEKGAERIAIVAESPGGGLLVVNDAWDPGWEARIDGAAAPIYPADVLVRAVPFPAGRHTVVMRYRPTEVRVGGWISAVAALVCVALALGRRFPARLRERSVERDRRAHPAPGR